MKDENQKIQKWFIYFYCEAMSDVSEIPLELNQMDSEMNLNRAVWASFIQGWKEEVPRHDARSIVKSNLFKLS